MIFVRHSKSAVRPDRPAHAWNLSRAGRRLAAELAAQLAPLEPDRVYTSCEPKAVETGGVVAAALGLEVHQLRQLGEHDRANVRFLTTKGFELSVKRCLAHPDKNVFGGETADEALERFSIGVDRVLETEECARPLVVTHGTVMSLYLARLSGVDPWEIWQSLSMPSYVDLDEIIAGERPHVYGLS